MFVSTRKTEKQMEPSGFLCSYVWQHLDTGYVQGMCDLLAPLLVILDDGQWKLKCKPCQHTIF